MSKSILRNLTTRTVECHLPGRRLLRLQPGTSCDVLEADRHAPAIEKLRREGVVEIFEPVRKTPTVEKPEAEEKPPGKAAAEERPMAPDREKTPKGKKQTAKAKEQPAATLPRLRDLIGRPSKAKPEAGEAEGPPEGGPETEQPPEAKPAKAKSPEAKASEAPSRRKPPPVSSEEAPSKDDSPKDASSDKSATKKER